MARGKNAPALFDVIHAAKKPPKASPTGGGVPTPKWWAKGARAADRPAADVHGSPDDEGRDPAPAPEPSGGTRRSWLATARQPLAQPPLPDEGMHAGESPTDDEPSKVVITRIYPPGVPARVDAVDDADDAYADREADDRGDDADPDAGPVFSRPPVDEPVEERPSWSARRARALAERNGSDPSFDPTAQVSAADLRGPRVNRWAEPADEMPAPRQARTPRRSAGPTPSALKAAVDPAVSLDRNAGEVRLRLSYAGAVLAAMILALVLVIAYLAGTRSTAGDSAADLPPGQPVGGSATAAAPTTPASGMMAAVSTTAPATPLASAPNPAPPVVAPAPAAVAAPAAPAPTEPAARQVGLMYVVMQSYPDRETARRAGEFLNRSGVPCTVVPGLSGFALRDWYSVVGQQSFPRTARGPAMQTYLHQLTALGPKFSNVVYNQFQPQPYIWRADSDAPRP